MWLYGGSFEALSLTPKSSKYKTSSKKAWSALSPADRYLSAYCVINYTLPFPFASRILV